MRQDRWKLSLAVAVSSLLTALVSLSGSAQQAPAPAPTARTRPAAEVLAQLGQSAGVVILADATVQGRLPLSGATATPETVEQQLAQMVRALPAGTTWVKLYVPAPANDRWDIEAVEAYARAQARLVGTIGRPAPAGMVELLGRQVPTAKANEAIATLNLKLVYLVTNTRAQSAQDAAAHWGQMTREQREAYAQQQAQRLMALDPASRLETLRQLMRRHMEETPQDMVFKMVIEQMPVGERVQLKQSVAADEEARGGGK
jgi:hypothetical protein